MSDASPLPGSYEEYCAVVEFHRQLHNLPPRRPSVGDPGVHKAEPGERVRVHREPGAKFTFIRYAEDKGGQYAVVLGGLPGHRIERCVTVDRIYPMRGRRRVRST